MPDKMNEEVELFNSKLLTSKEFGPTFAMDQIFINLKMVEKIVLLM